MIRSLHRATMVAATIAAALTATTASAASYTIDFANQSPVSNLGWAACPTGVSNCADSQKIGVGVLGGHLNSTGSGSATFSPASVGVFRGAGLGVSYGTDKASDATHQIDNSGTGSDFVALFFSQSVTLSSIFRANYGTGSLNRDTDASYMAYTGSLTNLPTSLPLGGFSYLDHSTSKTNSTALSNVWLIAANVNGQTNDAFKLSSIVVNTAPLAAVPEPATWAMMLLGFGMIGFGMRYGMRRSNTRFDLKVQRIAAGVDA
ncbi:PEPxxWA-CTERM sorting domain-containing protein [Sphingomonas rubra]|uniref:PEP-CTERM protein-sorting domain-containing protein n=1 Tax=Sphingomonas rubra TaxID=634430 RepID=A0A1I5QH98_9SPHN|nr:PEPxxWA-CTERM sorting domain-containing protein [Sphingomonas rubra]SFP45603.1 PEP-CTERM protein-sorting domain-containing protein [Sphingomonas rubra]